MKRNLMSIKLFDIKPIKTENNGFIPKEIKSDSIEKVILLNIKYIFISVVIPENMNKKIIGFSN